jgi:hypothetical protein
VVALTPAASGRGSALDRFASFTCPPAPRKGRGGAPREALEEEIARHPHGRARADGLERRQETCKVRHRERKRSDPLFAAHCQHCFTRFAGSQVAS